MIKPDGLSGKYKEKIKAAILDSGFRIVKETEVQLDAERASLFYAEHSQRSFFDSLVKYITRYYCCLKDSCLLCFLHIMLHLVLYLKKMLHLVYAAASSRLEPLLCCLCCQLFLMQVAGC